MTKKFIPIILSIAMCLTSVTPTTTEAKSKVQLNKTKVTVTVGKTTKLKITGTNKKVKWSTSNKNIATVSNNGLVKGVKKGSVNIVAKVNSKGYKCKVTVNSNSSATKTISPTAKPKPTPIVKIAYHTNDYSLAPIINNKKIDIGTITPKTIQIGVYGQQFKNDKVTATSSDSSVATIVEADQFGYPMFNITPIKDGDTTISVTVGVTTEKFIAHVGVINAEYTLSSNGTQLDSITNFKYYPELLKIPEGVTTLSKNTFSTIGFINTVYFPKSITEIPSDLYMWNCNSVYVPASITKSADFCFFDKTITIYGEKGSYAEQYASKNKLNFVEYNFK